MTQLPELPNKLATLKITHLRYSKTLITQGQLRLSKILNFPGVFEFSRFLNLSCDSK